MEWLTVKQMAERMHCSDRYVRKLIAEGRLHAIGDGRQRMVWAGSGEPIMGAGAPDFEVAIEPEDDLIRDLYHHLSALMLEIDTSKIGPTLRTEIEEKVPPSPSL